MVLNGVCVTMNFVFFLIYRTPIPRVPKINGHEIDLHKFYNLVTARGGWAKVSYQVNNWFMTMKMIEKLTDQLSERVGGPGSRIQSTEKMCKRSCGSEANLLALPGQIRKSEFSWGRQ